MLIIKHFIKNQKIMSSNDNDVEVNIEKIYDEVGHFGKYQFLALVILAFSGTLTSTTAYSFVFTTAEPDFR